MEQSKALSKPDFRHILADINWEHGSHLVLAAKRSDSQGLLLKSVPFGHEKVLIRVNPDDIRALEPYHDEFLKSMEETDSLELVESPNISQGGCLVETNLGTIDTQIETQLEQVRRNLNLPGTTSSREQ